MNISDSKDDVLSKNYSNEDSSILKFQELSSQYFKSNLTIAQYRLLDSDTLDKQLENCSEAKSTDEVMALLTLLVPYYFNCNLPLDSLLQNIDDILSFKSPNELFHLFFQNSETHLKAILVHHYSFSNPIPFYYPLIRDYSEEESVEFALCRELWYSLTPHNAVMSYGIGDAANNPVGKSTLLDLIFKLNFVPNNNCDSCFHSGSIDLRLTKNFFAGVECDPFYTDWAFFDFHGPTNTRLVNLILKQIDIVIIHVLQSDMINDFNNIQKQIQSLDLKDKRIYVFIRDVKDGNVSKNLENIYHQLEVQNLSTPRIEKAMLSKLKKIGGEIILQSVNIQKFTSINLEKILEDYDTAHFLDFQEKTIVSEIMNPIVESMQEHSVCYGFLNYYPIFVDLVKKKYQILGENDQNVIERLSRECSQCFDKLTEKKIPLGINTTFQDMISHPDAVLILWKLAQELQILTDETKDNSIIREQSNDKYSIEILWREAILNYKYLFLDNTLEKNEYTEKLSRSLCLLVKTGEPFELIDGDNLVFFSKELNSMLRYFHVEQTGLVKQFNDINPDNKITEAPLVVSIIGPQSSGKSTLLNYLFGCKFITSAGRCTRGVYGSLLELNKPVNNSKFMLLLDTEGVIAAERTHISTSSSIHFDRSLVLFCLSVSNIVIINLKGELDNEIHELMRICAHSLNHLKIHKTNMPKIIFVLNQNVDLSLTNRDISLRILINNLDKRFSDEKEHIKKISELIQLTKDDIFTLSTAYSMERVDQPGEKIFNKRVDIRNSCLNFALDSSSLRESIFERLNRDIIDSKRLSVNSMSEWFEMAGDTWSTIMKFQDIVKYKNFEEIRTNEKLKEVVGKLMNEHFYSKKEEIQRTVDRYSHEITSFDVKNTSAEQLKDRILQATNTFEDEFRLRRDECIIRFRSDEDARLDSMIFKENLEQLKKLIATEKLDYIICLESRSNEIYYQKKRKEYLAGFRRTITSNITNYLIMTLVEQDQEFERLWKEIFIEDDLGKLYRKQNLVDFYLMFSSQWDLIPLTELVEIYQNAEFDLDRVDEILSRSLALNLMKESQDKEPFFYPTNKRSFLKDIRPHYSYSNKLEYLKEDTFYYVHSTEDQESKFLKYFPNSKTIYKHYWVPEDCVPLLQSCSGYYSEHDIDWKCLSPSKQIIKLVTSFLVQKLNETVSMNYTNKRNIIQQIIEETSRPYSNEIPHYVFSKARKTEPIISHVTIQRIVDALEKRLSIFNHEISYIGAELTIHARRNIGTYVFSKTFSVHFNRIWALHSKNRDEISKEKKEMKKYFLKKVEIAKLIHLNEGCANSSSYDINIAEKYARTYIKSLQDKITINLMNNMESMLQIDKQMFSYQSITQEAVQTLSDYLDSEETSSNHSHFVVKSYCARNTVLEEIFNRRWEELISSQIFEVVNKVVEVYQRDIINTITQLRAFITLFNIQRLNSKQCFKPSKVQPNEYDRFNLDESPYRSMIMYLQHLLDPKVTHMKGYFGRHFYYNDIKMQPPSDVLLKKKVSNSCKLENLSKHLHDEGFFTTELIFNLHIFLSHLIESLQKYSLKTSLTEYLRVLTTIKAKYLRDSLGCTKKCPSCGIFCDQQMGHYTECSSSSGHQFVSMGGMTWGNDKHHSAIFLRCEEYTDDMVMALPDSLITWSEFKQLTYKKWDWVKYSQIPHKETEQRIHTIINVWDRFGEGILKYHRIMNGYIIAYRPYEKTNDTLASSTISKFQICFVIDATGSMGKDIEKVRLSIQRLVELYEKTNKRIEFRVVTYRDHCDPDIIATFPNDKLFIDTIHEINSFLGNIEPHGGGDDPEASLDGLAEGVNCIWDRGKETKRLIIHLYDAPPHGNFHEYPDYISHSINSNPDHCCCCSIKCDYDWEMDVWLKMKRFEIEYHGINTGEKRWTDFENTMKRKLNYLCKGFTKCGKEQVNDAVMQIFINYKSDA